jgi:hypothetical protein
MRWIVSCADDLIGVLAGGRDGKRCQKNDAMCLCEWVRNIHTTLEKKEEKIDRIRPRH